MKMKIMLVLIIAICLGINLNAQWQKIGPEGGIVFKVVSVSKGNLVCFTSGELYHSSDNGETWVGSKNNLSDDVTGLIIYKSKYYASTKSGIYNSNDGITWVKLATLNFYPIIFSSSTVMFGVSGSKIYRSIDDGISWGLTAGAYSVSEIRSPMIEIGTTLYLCTDNGIWLSENGGSLWKSHRANIGYVADIKATTNGFLATTSTGIYRHSNTTGFALSNTGIPVNGFGSIIMVTANKYFVTVGVINGNSVFSKLYSSTDGTTWAIDNSNYPAASIYSMAFYSSTGFICSSSGIFKSSDNGGSWKKSVKGIKSYNVLDITSSNNVLYAAMSNRSKGIFNSRFNGSYTGGIFSSTDNGVNWQMLGLPDSIAVEKIIVKNNSIIAYCYEPTPTSGNVVLYKSSNAGATWAKVTGYTNNLSSIYYENNTLFITTFGMNGAKIDISTDFGDTWQQITSTGYAAITSPLAINTAIGTTLFANSGLYISSGGGVFKSTDNGVTWVAVNNGLPFTTAIAYIKAVDNILYAYANNIFNISSALYKSTNLGASWSRIGTELPSHYLNNIYGIDGNGSVYVSTSYSNFGLDSGYVYESKNNGDTWNNISTGLPSVIMGNMAMVNSKLYVATSGYSIWTNATIVLPVTFISTYASRISADVQVNWKVGEEIGIHSYDIERSSDSRVFTKIGNAATTNNSLLAHSYSWVDANVARGTIHYRIKSIGVSGEIKYSDIIKVAEDNIAKSFSISPNPINGTIINLQFKNQSKGRYTIKLISTTGQVVFSSTVIHAGGSSYQLLNLSAGTVSGTYVLEMINPNNVRTTQTLFIRK